jgi:hypothetical protein
VLPRFTYIDSGRVRGALVWGAGSDPTTPDAARNETAGGETSREKREVVIVDEIVYMGTREHICRFHRVVGSWQQHCPNGTPNPENLSNKETATPEDSKPAMRWPPGLA